MKRGQVTIFVVVGIIIIILVFLVAYFKSTDFGKERSQANKLTTEEEIVRTLVQECINTVAERGIFIAQKQSGYIFLKNDGIDFEGYKVPFVFEKGKINVISIKEFQKDINDYISQNVPKCIKPEASFGKIQVRTILDKEIIIQVSYPFTILIKDGSVRNDQSYEYINEAPIKQFLEIIKEVAEETKRNPEAIHLTPLITQETFDSDTVLEENIIIYHLKDFIREEEYYFSIRRN